VRDAVWSSGQRTHGGVKRGGIGRRCTAGDGDGTLLRCGKRKKGRVAAWAERLDGSAGRWAD
jgi:hypothetical protein